MYNKNLLLIALVGFVFLSSCSPAKKVVTTPVENIPGRLVGPPPPTVVKEELKMDPFFTTLLKNYPGFMDSLLLQGKDQNVQIIYTEINRKSDGTPILKKHYFNRNDQAYFYPASTVKLPVALLALEKLNGLAIKGLDKSTTMITEAAYSGQTAVFNDPNTADGKPSIAQYIKKILLVSDNDAYNRLYEWLGQEYLNASLYKKGYQQTQLLHRLDIFLSEDENRHSNPVKFYDNNNNLVHSQPLLFNQKQYTARKDFLGRGYYSNGKLVSAPMDFSKKNRMTLEELNQVLTSVIFPETVPAAQRFNLTEEDRRFVLQYMSQLPSESVYPSYDSSYYDAYVKFILFGSEKGTLPKNIRIYNKVGDAYGQLTDLAYVVDFENNIEFMVSATIYCNEDGILNDNKYDYDKTGFPFMKNLGRAIYQHELSRKRNFKPDLSSLIFTYNK